MKCKNYDECKVTFPKYMEINGGLCMNCDMEGICTDAVECSICFETKTAYREAYNCDHKFCCRQ